MNLKTKPLINALALCALLVVICTPELAAASKETTPVLLILGDEYLDDAADLAAKNNKDGLAAILMLFQKCDGVINEEDRTFSFSLFHHAIAAEVGIVVEKVKADHPLVETQSRGIAR